MSIVDNFDNTLDAAFIRRCDSRTACHQFQISVVLLIVLFTAAFALGMMFHFDQGGSDTTPATNVHQSISLDA